MPDKILVMRLGLARCIAWKCTCWSFDRKTYTWSSPKSSHSWNPADFTMKSGRFHDIRQISWNPVDFRWNLVDFRWNLWNPVDFTLEIWWISPMKYGRFHPEIWQISPRYHLWNPPKIIKASVSAKTLQFDECRVGDFTLEIQWISSWNLVDFTMKSGGFHLWNLAISPRFDLWNRPKIIKASVLAKTLQFDECRVGDFTLEIQWISSWNLWISPWNLVDFTCEIWQISPRFHLWNPPKIIKASVSAKTLQFDECRVGDFTLEIQWISSWNLVDFTLKSGGFHLWNLADFTQISPVKSTQNYKSKCFSKNSSVWWMQGGDFTLEIQWISSWNLVDFTLKSGGFHLWNLADFTQISPVKSTQNYKSKCFSKNSSVWWMQGGGYDQGFHDIHQISPWNLVDFTYEIWQISPRFHL